MPHAQSRYLSKLLLAMFFCVPPVPCRGQTYDVLCRNGFGSFYTTFSTGVLVSVGAVKKSGLALRLCQASLGWNEHTLQLESHAAQVDIDVLGADLGLRTPVIALQVKRSELDPLMKYEIYSLKRPPRLLRTITGGDYYSAADTDMDGRIEIWTDDAGVVNGFDNIPLSALDFAPNVVLRFEHERLIDVSSEFQSHYDRQIAIVRAHLGTQQLIDFKNSDGSLSVTGPVLAESTLHSLIVTKIKVLEIVWCYLYSGRDKAAWEALGAMWPTADFERIRKLILEAQVRGIRAQIDGVSQGSSLHHFKRKQTMIYDRLSYAEPNEGNPLSWSYKRGMGGPPNPEHSFEGDSDPVEIFLRRPPSPDPDALRSELDTQVTVDLVIDAAGKVRSATAEGKPDQELIDATADWKFIPAFREGRPVASRLRIGVTPYR